MSMKLENELLSGRKQRSVQLDVYATIKLTVEIAQQLSWLASAVRVGLSETAVSYSEPSITVDVSPEPYITSFRISVAQRPLDSTEISCWFPLFNSAGIARGFPIPERGCKSGLEISIGILAALTRVRHAVEFQGGVVLKGFSTMLVPTERFQDGIRWHLIRNEDDSFMSYENGIRQCPDRLMLHEVNLDALRSTTTLVGWCSAAKIFLGSEVINYDNLHYSGFHLKDSRSYVSVSGGSFGFSYFATAQLNVTFGAKDRSCRFPRNDSHYNEVITMAENLRVLLFDTLERRAWLLPASQVILHIAQARLQTGFLGVDKEQVKLFSKDTSECSARETLMRDSNNTIITERPYSLHDLVFDIWSLLDSLSAHYHPFDTGSGLDPKSNFQGELHGFEFNDVVRKKSPCDLKKCKISKSSGGWVNLVQDIGALVLFANGFEDLIRPSETCQSLCGYWRSLPKGKDYLAVTVRMLKGLYEVAGSPLERTFLSSSCLQWHPSCSTFEPCKTQMAHCCGCSRLGKVVGKDAKTVKDPGNLDLYEEGAIILGQSDEPSTDICIQRKKPTQGLYSQKNQPINIPQASNDSGPCELSNSVSRLSIVCLDGSVEIVDSDASTTSSNDSIPRRLESGLEKDFAADQPLFATGSEECNFHSLAKSQQQDHLLEQKTFDSQPTTLGVRSQPFHDMSSPTSNTTRHASRIPVRAQTSPLDSSQIKDTGTSGHGLRRRHGQTNLGTNSEG